MAPVWEVKQFYIRTSAPSGVSDSLYANGEMQVPLDVSIRAAKSGKTYKLTDDELNTIKIVYYNDTTKELGFGYSDGWYCMYDQNDYYHTLSSTSSSASASLVQEAKYPDTPTPTITTTTTAADVTASASSDSDQAVQVKRFWVSTKKVENANFGASVLQPDKDKDGNITQTKITTASTTFDSHVTLTGIGPIKYTTDNITIATEDTASGTYQWDVDSDGKCHKEEKWTQKTWYISTKNHPLHKGSVWDVDVDHWGLFFAWDTGDGFSRNVGVEVSHMDGKHGTAKAWAGIKVNQKKGAVCLCRVNFDSPEGIWGSEWVFPSCHITLRDVYGNYGVIGASYSEDHDSVVVKNSEGNSEGRTWCS
ncbi:hypothetical protein TWF281_003835 [Arthrobotrys megalospora]